MFLTEETFLWMFFHVSTIVATLTPLSIWDFSVKQKLPSSISRQTDAAIPSGACVVGLERTVPIYCQLFRFYTPRLVCIVNPVLRRSLIKRPALSRVTWTSNIRYNARLWTQSVFTSSKIWRKFVEKKYFPDILIAYAMYVSIGQLP